MKDALMIGIGKKPGGPPPRPSGMDNMPSMQDNSAPNDDDGQDSGKKSPEEALVIRAGHDCDDCKNYHSDTGECDKVDGQFSPEDQCLRFFEAKGGESDDEEGEGMPEESGEDEAGEYGPQG